MCFEETKKLLFSQKTMLAASVLFVTLMIYCIDGYHYFESIHDLTCNVMEYGAVGGGKSNDSAAIQDAINSCFEYGSSVQIWII